MEIFEGGKPLPLSLSLSRLRLKYAAKDEAGWEGVGITILCVKIVMQVCIQ